MSYTEAWRENRRRWKRFLLWWVGGPIVFMVLSFLASMVQPLQRQKAVLNGIFFGVGLVWVLGTLNMGFRLFAGFHCPRCGKRFYMRGLSGNPYARRCLHCGLHKGAEESPEDNVSGE